MIRETMVVLSRSTVLQLWTHYSPQPTYESRHLGINPIFPLPCTPFPPADYTSHKISVPVLSHMWASAVSLTCILGYGMVTSTEHIFSDWEIAGQLADMPLDIGDINFFERGGYSASFVEAAKATDHTLSCSHQDLICKVGSGKARRDHIFGKLDRGLQLNEGYIVIIGCQNKFLMYVYLLHCMNSPCSCAHRCVHFPCVRTTQYNYYVI